MKHYKMTLQILSPVHIGSGQDIDPLEYVVKDGIFYRLDLPRFLSQMDGALRAEFNRKASDPNPVVLRDFIHRQADPQKHACFSADAVAFEAAYQRNLKNPNTKLEVTLMTRSPGNWQAYIPGSSIKGAIRTAVINAMTQTHNDKVRQHFNDAEEKSKKKAERIIQKKGLQGKKANQEREKIIAKGYENFGRYVLEPLVLEQSKFNPYTDPFRCLKIEDVFLPESPTFIDKAEIFNPNKSIGPDQMFYEQCFSMLDGETITAVGTLDIDDQLPRHRTFDKRQQKEINAVSRALNAYDLLMACRRFYLPKMQAEHEKFHRSNPESEQYSQELLAVKYADNEFPIRLGRFSHVECTTVDEYRKPQTRRTRDGRSLPWGTTRTLSGGTMPMGWAKVRLEPIK